MLSLHVHLTLCAVLQSMDQAGFPSVSVSCLCLWSHMYVNHSIFNNVLPCSPNRTLHVYIIFIRGNISVQLNKCQVDVVSGLGRMSLLLCSERGGRRITVPTVLQPVLGCGRWLFRATSFWSAGARNDWSHHVTETAESCSRRDAKQGNKRGLCVCTKCTPCWQKKNILLKANRF